MLPISQVIYEAKLWVEATLLGLELLALASVPSVLVQRAGRPLAALSWIMGMIIMPPIGLLLWWAMGRSHLKRQRRRRQACTSTVLSQLQDLAGNLACVTPGLPTSLLPLKRVPEELQHSMFPPTCGNQVDLLVDAKQAYPAMMEAIAAATHHVHVLFYIWNDDRTGREFLDLLTRKAREGVEVRMLCDAIGSPSVGKRFTRSLEEVGGQVARFLPPRLLVGSPTINFRNHRKIVVVDGAVGFTGGMNIGDEYRGAWHDLAVRVRGPAVGQMQEIFADDWYFATGRNIAANPYFGRWSAAQTEQTATVATVASGPDSLHNPMHDLLFMAINEARERVYLITPYFIPSLSILSALRSAVYRAVDVRVMVPAHSDVPLVRRASRSFYGGLLHGGVRLYEYQAAMLHTKAAVFDHELVLLGSANLDNRSFRLNFEASCFVGGHRINDAVAGLFLEKIEDSREVLLQEVQQRPWRTQLVDSAAHLLSPIL